MKLQKNIIKSLSLIFFILIVSTSCGEMVSEPKDDGDYVVISSLYRYNTYQVRVGSTVIGIQPINMTNAWKDYIGGKKLSTGNNWRFEKNGDYWEDSYSKTTQRATLVGVVIGRATDGNIYLMGMYYNHKMVFITGGAQFMLIYITEDGTEKGYYGGGREPQPLPDYSTKWHPYDSFFPQGLGKLIDY